MLRTFVNGKIHQLKVTGLQPGYNGSCLICPGLLAAAGIEPFEKVEIYSLTSTARIATYVFPGAADGEFTLNGGAALHFRLGDRVAVVAYRQEESFSGANCVIVDPSDNSVAETLRYKTAAEALVICKRRHSLEEPANYRPRRNTAASRRCLLLSDTENDDGLHSTLQIEAHHPRRRRRAHRLGSNAFDGHGRE